MYNQSTQIYSVLKCKPQQGVPWSYQSSKPSTTVRQGHSHAYPHYHLIANIDDNKQYTIVINIESRDTDSPMVLYYIDEDYKNPITQRLTDVFADKYTILNPEPTPNGIALDYVKSNILDPTMMIKEQYVNGNEDSLNEIIDGYVKNAIASNADVYAFGMAYSDPNGSSGIHDIHMNQGNESQYASEDNIYQDGGFFIHDLSTDKWITMFFAFQSQSFNTDGNGHRID